GFQRIAEGWTATFEQVRVGQSFGPGLKQDRREISIAAATTAVVASAAGGLVILVFILTSIIGVSAQVAVPRFGATRAKIAKVQRLASYRIAPDSTITPLRAGQALHAIVKNGPGLLLEHEKAPAITIPPQPPSPRITQDPFERLGGWQRAAFLKARNGFTAAERDFLRATADNSALEEFRMLARAPALDFSAAYWELGTPEGPRSWSELPFPRFEFVRNASNANAAQAALDFAAGRVPEAERRLRENISAGFLMMEHGRMLMLNLFGANGVANARLSLAAFYDATGRSREARAISAEEDPDVSSAEPSMRMDADEVNRMLGRTILDESEPLGLRWELLLGGFIWTACSDLHQVLFGSDSLYVNTLASARASLVRTQSDSLLFVMADRVAQNSSLPLPRGQSVWAPHRPVAWMVSTLTGNRQLEACVRLID
ncbi:MAG: hypothetical protein ACRENU_11425, partial [Gemmatimonadaceae bacterium]